jgi:hypothetical protein
MTQALAERAALDGEAASKAIASIDSRLTNRKWLNDNECRFGVDGRYTGWIFFGQGTLTAGTKAYICNQYSNAGWKHVAVKNSEDDGERPGLWAVELAYEIND